VIFFSLQKDWDGELLLISSCDSLNTVRYSWKNSLRFRTILMLLYIEGSE